MIDNRIFTLSEDEVNKSSSNVPAIRQRADQRLVSLGLFKSRAKAQAAIEAGLVTADGERVRKASQEISAAANICASAPHPYVSRGGLKLAHALERFALDARGLVCLDVGASTGGFSDVLLRAGARRVYAIDTGHDQFHHSLRKRDEIVLFEGFDARKLTRLQVPELIDLTVIDVSFISLALVLPAALALSAENAVMVALIKPQFEVGKANVGKGGIVKDDSLYDGVCERIAQQIASLGWTVSAIIPSPIEGGDGNREFLISARRGSAPA